MEGGYDFDWGIVLDNVDPLLNGLRLTIEVTLVGMAIAMVVGLPVALARLSSSWVISQSANFYTQVMRGVPLYVFLFWVYYGVSSVIGLNLGPFVAAAIALGLNGSGYMAEIYRGGLNSVDPGQAEAATALGLRRRHSFIFVVLPQALRVSIPPTVNTFVGLLKGATFVSVIGVADMFYVSSVVSVRYFKPFELYTVAALVLIALTVSVASLAYVLERRMGRGTVNA